MASAFLGDFLLYLCSDAYHPRLFYPFLKDIRSGSQNEEEELGEAKININAETEITETSERVANPDPQVFNFSPNYLLFLFIFLSLFY